MDDTHIWTSNQALHANDTCEKLAIQLICLQRSVYQVDQSFGI